MITPEVLMRPIELLDQFVNQSAPSDPMMMLPGLLMLGSV
jgi:hypothetical protein